VAWISINLLAVGVRSRTRKTREIKRPAEKEPAQLWWGQDFSILNIHPSFMQISILRSGKIQSRQKLVLGFVRFGKAEQVGVKKKVHRPSPSAEQHAVSCRQRVSCILVVNEHDGPGKRPDNCRGRANG